MTPADAEVYFILFKVLTEDDLSFLAKRSNQSKLNPIRNSLFPEKTASGGSSSGLFADFRELIIFMFLQTFSTSLKHNIDMKQKEFNAQWEPNVFGHFNESIRGNPPSPLLSQLSSPRSQTTRIPMNNEYPQAAKFLKNNIKQILKFIVGDLTTRNNPHVNISPDDFDILSFLFNDDPQMGGFAGLSLSEFSGLFKNPKVSITAAADWISNNIASENTNNVVYLQNMNKSVTMKDKQACGNREVRIIGCEDTYIYIDACVSYMSIVNCINTHVFVASVERICTIDKCENLTLTVASNFIRIGNTIDSTINYYGSFHPVLFGDNRSVVLGPYNANYIGLPERIKEARISTIQPNVTYFDDPLVVNALENSGTSFKIQKIEDFINLVLPDTLKPITGNMTKAFDALYFGANENRHHLKNEGNPQEEEPGVLPILCPSAYRDEIKRRHLKNIETREMINSLKLDGEGQKLLHFILQSNFKDYLVTSGALKPIIEMTKMITKD